MALTPELEERLKGMSITERNKAIVEARQQGATLRQIAALVELTHGGIRKIIKRAEQP